MPATQRGSGKPAISADTMARAALWPPVTAPVRSGCRDEAADEGRPLKQVVGLALQFGHHARSDSERSIAPPKAFSRDRRVRRSWEGSSNGAQPPWSMARDVPSDRDTWQTTEAS